jgi:hypothetical protein
VVLIVSLLLMSLSSNAAIEPQPALPLRMSIEKDVDAKVGQKLGGIVQVALNFVRLYPPRGYENNLFTWSRSRKILNGKSFKLHLTTSRNATFAPLLKNSDPNMDSFTTVQFNLTQKEMPISLVLLVDRIFYDKFGNERPQGFSKLVLALAHEIYGNVQHYLEFNIENAQPQTIADRVFQQRKAFHASLMFLGRLKDSNEFSKLPANVREGLLNLIPAELRAYRSWQQANPDAALDPACEAMLRSLDKNED